mgnify:CR=1 FL=1
MYLVARKIHVYTEKEYNSFLENIDIEYDDDFGGQELFGYIWYKENIKNYLQIIEIGSRFRKQCL